MASGQKIDCVRCFMPFPEGYVNARGECVTCSEYRKKWLNRDYGEKQQELTKLCEHYKRRNRDKKYDSIVALTGGKDSTYALYLAVQKYGLRPLAVTADHGALSAIARENMKRTVARLGIDHLVVSRDEAELKSLYRAFFKKTRNFCEVCYLTILNSLYQAAVDHDVPLIITGAAFKVDSSYFRAPARYCVEDAVVNLVKDTIPAEVYGKYLSKELRRKHDFHIIHIFDYVDYVQSEIYEVLGNKLGWHREKGEDRHADCEFHDMLGYLRFINGDLTSLVFMGPAGLLRDEQITADEFRELVAKEREQFGNIDEEKIAEFIDFFGIDEAFLTENLDSPRLAEPLVRKEHFDVLQEYRERPGITEEDLIGKLLDVVRPELKRDGGDISVLGFRDNALRIELLGACRGCYMADIVMMRYLEYLVRTYISEEIVIHNVRELV